jgi:hypothetical protein
MTPRLAPAPIRWWLRLTDKVGITLPPWGVYIRAECLADERLCRHEMAHWRQYQRMGTLRFYAVYLWGLMRYGYRNHPMEIEARAAEDSRVV